MKIRKELDKGNFDKIYDYMNNNNIGYSIESIFNIFEDCPIFNVYTYLMYSISKKELAIKHMTICQYLKYSKQYILEADNLIYWHVNRAAEFDHNFFQILEWVLENYGSCPTSPFKNDELNDYAIRIIKLKPESLIARRFLH